MQEDDPNQYKGNFYNWLVATAGKGVYTTPANTTIEDSICPKGWRLPLGTRGNKSWYNLVSYAGSSADIDAWFSVLATVPYSLIRAGNYNPQTGERTEDVDSGAANNSGFYFSATTANSTAPIYLGFTTKHVLPEYNNFKGWGDSIRCVSR